MMKAVPDDLHEAFCLLQEECAEVIQAISKIDRFGLEAKHPRKTENNQNELLQEMADVLTLIGYINSKYPDKFPDVKMEAAIDRKKTKLMKYCKFMKDFTRV